MNLHPVSISLSSFGADYVRAHGQASLAALLRNAGASHIELREELFTDLDMVSLQQAVAAQALTCVYSSPLELWQPGTPAPNPQLLATLARAKACGALWLKVSLGFYSALSDLSLLAECLRDQPVQLLIENDQTAQGGRIDPLVRFFGQARERQVPVGMTFDIGNWQWQAQSVSSAALQLGAYVRYVHCKGVTRSVTGKLVATPPTAADLHQWDQLLKRLGPDLVRAIEYPLQADDLAHLTQQHVAVMARLGNPQREVAHG